MGGEFAYSPGLFLMRFGGVFALFVLVILFVRHRREEEENRRRGIVLSALVTIFGWLLFFAGPMLLLFPLVLIYAGGFILLYLVIPAFVAAALADLGLRAMGAERTRFWLVSGAIAAIAITIIWIAVLFGEMLSYGAWGLDLAILSLVPVSTALTWWSYLPRAAEDVAGTFE